MTDGGIPPTPHARAAVLSIGDELVLGQTLDTNSQRLSQMLLDVGIRVVEHATVADDLGIIRRAIERFSADVSLLLISGGLGPTADDLTRAALADAMGDELIEDVEALEQIEAWYKGRGRKMPEANRVQALRPSHAACLENLHGTAPGLRAVLEGCEVYCLPGPPRELEPMFTERVLPRITGPRGVTVRTRVFRLIGIGESDVADRLGLLMDRDRNPLVGTTASLGVVTVRMRDESEGAAEEAEARLDDTEALVREKLRPHDGGSELVEEQVLGLLRDRGQRLSVVESCTGGLIGARLTGVAGSSAAFTGGWITYTNAMKHDGVGVPETHFPESGSADAPGAVSRETALSMAEGGLTRARHELGGEPGVDWCLSVTGIAGPSGGSDEKPVGTVWVALAGRDGTRDARRFQMRGDRDAARLWAVSAALSMLWMRLTHGESAERVSLLRQSEP
ncbi:MAG: CinA family nicotinamide mononucleotide deamidase-related protein [Planctomycetota bacterium]